MLTSLLILCVLSPAVTLNISSGPIHLRSGAVREWRSFPERASGASIELVFSSTASASQQQLVLRQRDVKGNAWVVSLNGTKLGVLQDDERTMWRRLPIPVGLVRNGENRLSISGAGAKFSDDIELSQIRMEDVAAPAEIEVRVEPAQPSRITIVDREGTLVPFQAMDSGMKLAVRTGVAYTPDGHVRLGVPPGEYTVYASRGFEYNAPSVKVTAPAKVRLKLRREVVLPGYISCDTHIHTLELSGHGDASVDERVLTAAGEGLDLMIPTEHNRTVDYRGTIDRLGLAKWLVSLPGNEITTAIGHFNVFPLTPGAPFPDPKQADWALLMKSLQGPGRVVIQNHPQDVHSGYRPFAPEHHLSSVGTNLNGRPFLANAMEVINSGAMFSDPVQLVRDWMGLLTRGTPVAAIGSSDTHTVDFVPIAQARTYIDVGSERSLAAERLAAGRNLVSYGLVAELKSVSTNPPTVKVTVWGPSWAKADTIRIFSNGTQVWQARIADSGKGGVKFQQQVRLTLPRQDVALVALATGPGALYPFWEVRKPYQPTSDEWTPLLLGLSAATWLDVDGDGRTTSPLEHARRLLQDPASLGRALAGFDAAVTLHAVDLLRAQGRPPAELRGMFEGSAPVVREAYERYLAEYKLVSGR